MKKTTKFTIFNLIFLCVMVLLIAVIPTLSAVKQKSELPLQENFMGELSSFQGVINVWNVDTFESGSAPKSDFITDAGLEFSKKHNGLYFLVKNITVNEMLNNFMNNIFPDIISFGYGIAGAIKPYLQELNSSDFSEVRSEVVGSGMLEEKLMAVGYLMGGYILASTTEKLSKAKEGTVTDLSSVINSMGYDSTIGKKQKHISSVVVGDNPYVNPCTAMNNFEGLALTDYYLSSSSYDAYLDFVSYNMGTILVGTQRDLFKLSGRIKVGKIDGVVLNYLTGFTNLVQYVGVINNIMEEKKQVANEFIKYLVSYESQEKTTSIGMVNVLKQSYYLDGEFLNLENALNKDLVITNIFTK